MNFRIFRYRFFLKPYSFSSSKSWNISYCYNHNYNILATWIIESHTALQSCIKSATHSHKISKSVKDQPFSTNHGNLGPTSTASRHSVQSVSKDSTLDQQCSKLLFIRQYEITDWVFLLLWTHQSSRMPLRPLSWIMLQNSSLPFIITEAALVTK